jgi:N-acetylglutamate synthase-like GNAT family acetyltransferase
MATHQHYSPGLGGYYLPKAQRLRGVGSELIQSGMAIARALGYQTLYATTNTAGGILERLGWKPMGSLLHHEEQIALYRYTLMNGERGMRRFG